MHTTYILPYTVRLRTVKLEMILGCIYGLIAGCGKSADEETSSDPLSVCAASAWQRESDPDAATGPLPAEALSWRASLDTLGTPIQRQHTYLDRLRHIGYIPWFIHTIYLYHKQAYQLAAHLSKFGEYTPEDTASDRDQAASLPAFFSVDEPVFYKAIKGLLDKAIVPMHPGVSEKKQATLRSKNLMQETMLLCFQYYVLPAQDQHHAHTRVCHHYIKMMMFSNFCYLYMLLSSGLPYKNRLKAYDVRIGQIKNTLICIQDPWTTILNFYKAIQITKIKKVNEALHMGIQYRGKKTALAIPCSVIIVDLIEELAKEDVATYLQGLLEQDPVPCWNLIRLYVLKELVPIPEAEHILEELKKGVRERDEVFDAEGDIKYYIKKCLAVRTAIEHMAKQVQAVEQGNDEAIQQVVVPLIQWGLRAQVTTRINVIGPCFWDIVLGRFSSYGNFFEHNQHTLSLLDENVLNAFDQSIQAIHRSIQQKNS